MNYELITYYRCCFALPHTTSPVCSSAAIRHTSSAPRCSCAAHDKSARTTAEALASRPIAAEAWVINDSRVAWAAGVKATDRTTSGGASSAGRRGAAGASAFACCSRSPRLLGRGFEGIEHILHERQDFVTRRARLTDDRAPLRHDTAVQLAVVHVGGQHRNVGVGEGVMDFPGERCAPGQLVDHEAQGEA